MGKRSVMGPDVFYILYFILFLLEKWEKWEKLNFNMTSVKPDVHYIERFFCFRLLQSLTKLLDYYNKHSSMPLIMTSARRRT